jgi:lysophospholipase L1-like esterase
LLVAAAGFVLVSPARADESSGVHYYVALGDSLAEGYQPNGEVGHGYADQLYATLKVGDPKLQLENLACGGETTSSMISGVMPWGGLGSRYFCGYRSRSAQLAHGSQLADAIAFLRAHRRFVSLITIDVGGNDVGDCVAALDEACLDAGLVEVRANLQSIVASLRDAAGPEVPIVGMTYCDPFSVLWFDSPAAGQKVDDLVQIVNTTLDEIYTARRIPVAQVDDAFAVGTFPDSASNACTWTWMCTASPDIHPNTSGYGVIAQTFGALLSLPYLDDAIVWPYIGPPQISCPQAYAVFALFEKPPSDPLWKYDLNDDFVICKRWP